MSPTRKKNQHLTPPQVVQQLDQYIVGQTQAKRQLAVALRNKWRRSQADPDLQKEIVPTNMLIIGPTGTGKTECARRLANIINAPFIKVEAPRFTERGYVGGDVNDIIHRLADNAFAMVKQQQQQRIHAQALQNVEETILDTLIPPAVPEEEDNNNPDNNNDTPDNAPKAQPEDINQATRERFRTKLQQGHLDDYKIDIVIPTTNNPIQGMGFIGTTPNESAIMNLENLFNKILPKTTKKKKVTIQEAKKILLEAETNNLLDLEAIKEQALHKTQNEGIVFIDEIDKIATNAQQNNTPNVSREGVQRDLLPIVEGTTISTKYGIVNTDHILFIAAGAFHVSQPSDLLPELQGRLSIRVKLNPLSEKDLERILQEPTNSLIKQYQALFDAEGITLTFAPEAIQTIAHIAFISNQTMENIGARRLRTVLNHLLSEYLFDAPDTIPPGQTIHIDQDIVRTRLTPLVEQTDHTKYIL